MATTPAAAARPRRSHLPPARPRRQRSGRVGGHQGCGGAARRSRCAGGACARSCPRAPAAAAPQTRVSSPPRYCFTPAPSGTTSRRGTGDAHPRPQWLRASADPLPRGVARPCPSPPHPAGKGPGERAPLPRPPMAPAGPRCGA